MKLLCNYPFFTESRKKGYLCSTRKLYSAVKLCNIRTNDSCCRKTRNVWNGNFHSWSVNSVYCTGRRTKQRLFPCVGGTGRAVPVRGGTVYKCTAPRSQEEEPTLTDYIQKPCQLLYFKNQSDCNHQAKWNSHNFYMQCIEYKFIQFTFCVLITLNRALSRFVDFAS